MLSQGIVLPHDNAGFHITGISQKCIQENFLKLRSLSLHLKRHLGENK